MTEKEKADLCEMLNIVADEAVLLRTTLLAGGTPGDSDIATSLGYMLESARVYMIACLDLCTLTATEKI